MLILKKVEFNIYNFYTTIIYIFMEKDKLLDKEFELFKAIQNGLIVIQKKEEINECKKNILFLEKKIQQKLLELEYLYNVKD